MTHGRLSTVLAAMTFGVTSTALADCGSFEAVSDGSQRSVEFVDLGPDGTSVGDQRIGYREVTSFLDGATGEHLWINTIVRNDADGNPTRSLEEHVVRFDDGSIFYSVSNALVSPSSDTAKPSVGDHFGAVTGGTGTFESATGSVGIAFDGNAITYTFNIECD